MARELLITVKVDKEAAKAGLRDVEQGVTSLTQSAQQQEAAMKAALGILTAQNVRQFVGDLKAAAQQFVGAFSEQEAASKSLTAALQAQGAYTPQLAQRYDALATSFEDTTVFSDELLLSMESLLTQVGSVGPAQMDKALKASTDLAAGLGIDLRSATLLVAKAFEGHTETLARYGIILDATKVKADPVKAVLEGINEKFGGQAQAQLDTYSGKMAQLSNRMNNAEESIGGVIANGLSPFLSLILDLPAPLQSASLGLVALTANLAPAALSFVTLVPGLKILIPLLETGLTSALATAGAALSFFFLTPAGLAILAVAGLAAGLLYLKTTTDTTIPPVRDLGIDFNTLGEGATTANDAMLVVGGDGMPSVIEGANDAAAAVKRLTAELADNARQAAENDAAVQRIFNPKPQEVPLNSVSDLKHAEDELTESVKKSIAEHERLKGIQDKLFGRDLIARANELVGQLGGVQNITHLTTENQRELNTAVTGAIAVYKALGQTAPPILQEIANATALAGSQTMTMALAFQATVPQIRSTMTEADHLIPILSQLPELLDKVPLALYAWPPMLKNMSGQLRAVGTSLASDLFNDFGPTLQRAFEGGGDVLKSIGGKIGGNITKHIFGAEAMQGTITSLFGKTLGAAFNDLLPGIGALVGPLLEKISGFFAHVFGGPSKQELAGRASSDAFTSQIKGMLDWQQQIETHQLVAAGNSEKWATQVVGVRDAYLAAGLSVDDALDAVNRLWLAEKQGGGAAQVVIDEIIAKTNNLSMANDKATKAFETLVASFDGKSLIADAELVVKAIDSIGGASMLTETEQKRVNGQLVEALAKYAALGLEAPQAMIDLAKATGDAAGATGALALALTPAGAAFARTGSIANITFDDITTAARNAAGAAERALQKLVASGTASVDALAAASQAAAAAETAAADAAFNAWAKTYNYINGGGSGVDPTKQALSPENYATKADWQSAYLQFNPGARPGQIESAWQSNSVVPDWAKTMHTGGPVEPINFTAWKRAHSGLAVDEVPIIAQTGEGILSRRGMQALGGRATLDAMNAGRSGGGDINVTIEKVSVDRGESEEQTAARVGRAVVVQLKRRGVRFKAAS